MTVKNLEEFHSLENEKKSAWPDLSPGSGGLYPVTMCEPELGELLATPELGNTRRSDCYKA